MSPEYALSIQMARWHLAEQHSARQRHRVALLELALRRDKNTRNVTAARLAIADIEKQIASATTPLEKQRLRSQIAAQNATIERQLLEDLEGAERAATHDADLTAADAAIVRLTKQLEDLEGAHGPLTDDLFTVLRASIDG